MAVTIVATTTDKNKNDRQQAAALRVLDEYEGKFPDLDLLIFLDDQIWDSFRAANGTENRGLFYPINEHYFGEVQWPLYLRQELVQVDPQTFKESYKVDGIIYLHGDTADDESSLTMTLAHELQHFIQYGLDRTTWAWNGILTNCGELIDAENLTWHDIPIEHEARIAAKRVSQRILGNEKTDQYIELRRTQATKPRDVGDWEFVKSIEPSQAYDCVHETRVIFSRFGREESHRREMNRVLSMGRKKFPEYKELSLDSIIDT
jgi:hypothetical protein